MHTVEMGGREEEEMRPDRVFPVAYKFWSRQMWLFVPMGMMSPRTWGVLMKDV